MLSFGFHLFEQLMTDDAAGTRILIRAIPLLFFWAVSPAWAQIQFESCPLQDPCGIGTGSVRDPCGIGTGSEQDRNRIARWRKEEGQLN